MTIEELMQVELKLYWMPDSSEHNIRPDDPDIKTIAYSANHGGHEIIVVSGDFPSEPMYFIYIDRQLAKSVDGLPYGWKLVTHDPNPSGKGQCLIPIVIWSVIIGGLVLVGFRIIRVISY